MRRSLGDDACNIQEAKNTRPMLLRSHAHKHVRARARARARAHTHTPSLHVCRSLADDVCNIQEAKNVYPLLGIIANVGLVIGGAWIKMVNNTLCGES